MMRPEDGLARTIASLGNVLVENALVLFLVKMWKRLVAALGPRLGEHDVIVLQQETGRAFPAIILHLGIRRTSVVGHLLPAFRRQAEGSSANVPIEHRASWNYLARLWIEPA